MENQKTANCPECGRDLVDGLEFRFDAMGFEVIKCWACGFTDLESFSNHSEDEEEEDE